MHLTPQLVAGMLRLDQSELFSFDQLFSQKDMTLRFCVDSQFLNGVSILETYLLLHMDN